LSKKADSPVHIEWSSDWVRATNIATGQTAEAATIAGLGSILSGVRDVIVGVGRRQVFLKTARLPKAAPDDVRRILSVQMGTIFPLPADQLAFDFVQSQDLNSEGALTLIAAMRAGLAAGGEAGPIHSAGLKIVDRVSWPIADLRCDWTQDCPIEAIATLWGIYKPQLDAYVQRALNPDEAPSYGVPGDE